MFLYRISFLFFCLICVASCGPRTEEDFREEGEGVVRSLLQELRGIRTREQLVRSLGKLQRHFDNLAAIMLAAQQQLASQKREANLPASELSDQLYFELNRIYHLEGGRQLIEKCQESALRDCKTITCTIEQDARPLHH